MNVGGDQSTDPGDDFVCFIIGPIGDRLSEPDTEARRSYEEAILTVENLIEPACHEAGIPEPIRADRYAVAGEIPEQVFRMLRDADVVIADLTDANPNVMYELGLRHSKNKLTLQVGERSRLPFDVQSIRTILFRRTEGGYIDAKNTLREMLEQGLTGRFDPVSATRIWNEDAAVPAAVDASSGPAATSVEQLDHAVRARDENDEALGPPGYIEILVDLEDAMPRVNETLKEINEVSKEFGEIADRGTDEARESDERQGGARGRLVVAIRFAERLDGPIERLENAASRLRTDATLVDRGLTHIFRVIRDGAYQEEEVEDLRAGLTSIAAAGDAVAQAKPAVTGFRDSVAGLSDMARPVRTRVARLTKALDRVLEFLQDFERWGKEAREILEGGFGDGGVVEPHA